MPRRLQRLVHCAAAVLARLRSLLLLLMAASRAAVVRHLMALAAAARACGRFAWFFIWLWLPAAGGLGLLPLGWDGRVCMHGGPVRVLSLTWAIAGSGQRTCSLHCRPRQQGMKHAWALKVLCEWHGGLNPSGLWATAATQVLQEACGPACRACDCRWLHSPSAERESGLFYKSARWSAPPAQCGGAAHSLATASVSTRGMHACVAHVHVPGQRGLCAAAAGTGFLIERVPACCHSSLSACCARVARRAPWGCRMHPYGTCCVMGRRGVVLFYRLRS